MRETNVLSAYMTYICFYPKQPSYHSLPGHYGLPVNNDNSLKAATGWLSDVSRICTFLRESCRYSDGNSQLSVWGTRIRRPSCRPCPSCWPWLTLVTPDADSSDMPALHLRCVPSMTLIQGNRHSSSKLRIYAYACGPNCDRVCLASHMSKRACYSYPDDSDWVDGCRLLDEESRWLKMLPSHEMVTVRPYVCLCICMDDLLPTTVVYINKYMYFR